MNPRYAFWLFFLLMSAQLPAQVSYSLADYASISDTFLLTRHPLTFDTTDFVSPLPAGGTWDYVNLGATSQVTTRFENPDQAGFRAGWILECVLTTGNIFGCPGQWDDLSNLASRTIGGEVDLSAVLPVGVSASVPHFKKGNNLLVETLLGLEVGASGAAIPLAITYENPDTLFHFPLQTGNQDSSRRQYAIDLNPVGVDVALLVDQYRKNVVLESGTLITPFDTFANAIKVRTTVRHNDSLRSAGSTNLINNTTDLLYQWFVPGYGQPVLQAQGLLLAGNPVITQVTYLDRLRCIEPQAAFFPVPPFAFLDTTSGTPVNFINLSQSADSFGWDFADGQTSDARQPSHTFTAAGVYTVTLIGCNTLCQPPRCDTVSFPVTIADSTTTLANFTYSPTQPCAGDTVSFTSLAVNADSLAWDFGDGSPGSGPTPSHVYADSGGYEVAMIAIRGSNRDTSRQVLRINRPPSLLMPSDTTLAPGDSVWLLTSGWSPGDFLIWDFRPGMSCLLCPDPVVRPTQTTTYFFNASNGCGSSRDSVTVTVDSNVGLENDWARSLKVYPVPATGRVVVEWGGGPPGAGYRVLSLSGKVLASGPLPQAKNPLDLQAFPAGMYLLEVQQGGSRVLRKIVLK